MARRIPGEFVPLDVTLPRKPEIRSGGPDAELMFIRSLIYLGTSRTNGVLPEYDLAVWSAGLRNVPKSVAHLVETGLWVVVPDGWLVPSWAKWNRTTEERAEIREAKRLGAMTTNHKKGLHDKPVDDCPDCPRPKGAAHVRAL